MSCSSVALAAQALEHVVGPPQQVGPVLGPHAERVADHDHRQVGGDVVDEVGLALLADGVEDLVQASAHRLARCRAPAGG